MTSHLQVGWAAASMQGTNYPGIITDPRKLGHAQVDLWSCQLDGFRKPQDLLVSLDASENARFHRFKCADAGRQFAGGRALTRAALSHYANVPERAWRFSVNEHGRPAVEMPTSERDLHFNLSHTGTSLVLAVGRIAELGIDIESIDRPVDIEEVGRMVFTQAELSWVCEPSPAGVRRNRFFDLWTLKEAYIKARGRGFSLPPASFGLVNEDGRYRLECARECDVNPARWNFHLWSPQPNRRIALAIGSPSDVRISKLTYCLATKEIIWSD